jgi:putative pyoverdin transport system ATP-binding/permease protein
MKLLKLFSSRAPNKVFVAIVAGALAGIAYALLIPLMMSSLNAPGAGLTVVDDHNYQVFGFYIARPKFAVVFFALCLLILLLRTISQVLLTRISIDVTTELRQNLYKRISRTSIASLELHGSSRLIQAMTNDVQRIVFGASMIPGLLIQLFTLVGLLGFLCYISQKVFEFVVIMIIIGGFTFQAPMVLGARYMTRARLYMDDLQDDFRGLIDGAKELKLNRNKSENFIKSQLLHNERKIVDADKAGFTISQIATNYGDMITFFVMGIIAFIYTSYNSISVFELSGVLMVLLYITGPVAFILSVFPSVARAKISLDRIQALFDDLPVENIVRLVEPIKEWNTMRLRSVCYRHRSVEIDNESELKGFGVGPINAEIKRGQITFIVGGNGSGKSTLAKVISLHYFADSGEIAFDDVVVTSETLNSYRQEIACIYSDYYLFKQLHSSAIKDEALFNQVSTYLERLQLKGKVEFRDSQFTTLKLSDGQKRRLALLVAFLDDKSLYVFDEWAADQDPHFKEVFYFEILPSLKAQGKAVVAISHDDRYFNVADQILYMQEGVLAAV